MALEVFGFQFHGKPDVAPKLLTINFTQACATIVLRDSFFVGDTMHFGQDRLWMVAEDLGTTIEDALAA